MLGWEIPSGEKIVESLTSHGVIITKSIIITSSISNKKSEDSHLVLIWLLSHYKLYIN